MLLSHFCLTPPGDTPKRRGFVEALLLGCVPVVFADATRASLPGYLSRELLERTTVLMSPDVLRAGGAAVADALAARLPHAPVMRAAMADIATTLQWSYGEPTAAEAAEVGPDALDVALVRVLERARAAP